MSEKRILRVGLIQQANTADHSDNKRRLKEAIRSAAAQGAELVVLQELHNGLYFCQTEDVNVFDQAEPIPGPSTEEFGALAAELGIVLVLSLFERRATGLYHNTSVVLERDGSIAGKYRKMHIPDDPAYYEKFYFTLGIWASSPSRPLSGRSAYSSAGTSGIPKQPASWHSQEPRCSSTPRLSATKVATSWKSRAVRAMPGSSYSAVTR